LEYFERYRVQAPNQRALVLALQTGQRQGDLLKLPWSAYDGTWIRLKQHKTGRKVNVPVTRRLRSSRLRTLSLQELETGTNPILRAERAELCASFWKKG
jgi:integrase